MIKLESCPFCGGEAMIFVSESVCVMCKKCHCQTFPRADGKAMPIITKTTRKGGKA
jgi:NADH pyrophosphatase NudC (nudix superfamily)